MNAAVIFSIWWGAACYALAIGIERHFGHAWIILL
jgi:hypothetical protein